MIAFDYDRTNRICLSVISRTEEAAKKRDGAEIDYYDEWWKDSIQDSIVTRCGEYRFDVGSDDFLEMAERKRRKLHSMGHDVIDVDSSRGGGGGALFGFVVTRRSFETRLFQRALTCSQ